MQDNPLLEKLDWIFTSAEWTSKYPNTMATPMAKLSFDHVPINIQVDSKIPKCHMFRFDEFWLDFEGFIDTITSHLNNCTYFADPAKNIVDRFKSIRKGLKAWSRKLSQLNKTIEN